MDYLTQNCSMFKRFNRTAIERRENKTGIKDKLSH